MNLSILSDKYNKIAHFEFVELMIRYTNIIEYNRKNGFIKNANLIFKAKNTKFLKT